MPFTFCHPAIVLPFVGVSKSRLSASAMIAGSMAPDFEYFLKMRMSGVHGHTLEGIFYFNLPITILLLLLFHLFVRDSLIKNLPQVFQRRFSNLHGFDWLSYAKKRWYVVIYSALIGIGSHLFWDSFTHQGRFFATIIPFLHGEIDVFGVTLLRTEFAQLFSSVIGAILILAAIILPTQQQINWHQFSQKLVYWWIVVSLTILIVIIRNPIDMSQLIATGISAGMISLILAPSTIKLLKYLFTVSTTISRPREE